MKNEKSGSGGFVSGLMIGLLVGSAAAMLAAPQTGEETRDLLRGKVREAGEQVGGIYTKGKQVIAGARGTLDDAIAEGKEAAEQQRDQQMREHA